MTDELPIRPEGAAVTTQTKTAGLVLGAGQGRRLGRGPKAFVVLAGKPLLVHAVERMRRLGIELIVAVLPPEPDPISLPEGVRVVRNPEVRTGPLGSACLGVTALPGDIERGMLYPVDHYAVTDESALSVLQASTDASGGIARVVPRFEGRGGHPVVLLSPALAALRSVAAPDRQTLRDVLGAAGDTRHVDTDDAGVIRNPNHPQDLPEHAG